MVLGDQDWIWLTLFSSVFVSSRFLDSRHLIPEEFESLDGSLSFRSPEASFLTNTASISQQVSRWVKTNILLVVHSRRHIHELQVSSSCCVVTPFQGKLVRSVCRSMHFRQVVIWAWGVKPDISLCVAGGWGLFVHVLRSDPTGSGRTEGGTKDESGGQLLTVHHRTRAGRTKTRTEEVQDGRSRAGDSERSEEPQRDTREK